MPDTRHPNAGGPADDPCSTAAEAREPLNGTIHLAPYDSAWPALYRRLAARVRDALGDKALLLEHVGSTSVPGLSAKPVIDMLLAVADAPMRLRTCRRSKRRVSRCGCGNRTGSSTGC